MLHVFGISRVLGLYAEINDSWTQDTTTSKTEPKKVTQQESSPPNQSQSVLTNSTHFDELSKIYGSALMSTFGRLYFGIKHLSFCSFFVSCKSMT